MKKLSIITLTVIGMSSFIATAVQAQNPHFIRCSASGPNSDGDLNVCFKAAGFGAGSTVDVTVSATATVTYGCLNRGQHCPGGLFTTTQNVSTTGTFTVGRTGQVSGCEDLAPPPPTRTCPSPNMTQVLVSVSYSNVSVTAEGAGECNPSGTFSENFFSRCP
jgi:hypothetical protein